MKQEKQEKSYCDNRDGKAVGRAFKTMFGLKGGGKTK